MMTKIRTILASLLLLLAVACGGKGALETLSAASSIATLSQLRPEVEEILKRWKPSDNEEFNNKLINEVKESLGVLYSGDGDGKVEANEIIAAAGGAAKVVAKWDFIKYAYGEVRTSVRKDLASFSAEDRLVLARFNSAAEIAAIKIDALFVAGGPTLEVAVQVIQIAQPLVQLAVAAVNR